jgi:hypothetical protein
MITARRRRVMPPARLAPFWAAPLGPPMPGGGTPADIAPIGLLLLGMDELPQSPAIRVAPEALEAHSLRTTRPSRALGLACSPLGRGQSGPKLA